MSDHADTVRRVLRGEDVPAVDRINALADIASAAVHEKHRLQDKNRQLREALAAYRSALRSGEPYSDQLRQIGDAALAVDAPPRP